MNDLSHPRRLRALPLILAALAWIALATALASPEARAAAPRQTTAPEVQRRAVRGQWGGAALSTARGPEGRWTAVGVGMRIHALSTDPDGDPRLSSTGALLDGRALDLAPLADGRHAVVAAGRAGLAVVDMEAEGGPALVARAGLAAFASYSQSPGSGHILPDARWVGVRDSIVVIASAGHLALFDLALPTSPVLLSEMSASLTGRPAFAGEALLAPANLPSGHRGLLILRVADPRRPVPHAELLTGFISDIAVIGDLAVATSGSTLVLDLGQPLRPRVLSILREHAQLVRVVEGSARPRVLLGHSDSRHSFAEDFSGFSEVEFFDTRLSLVDLSRPEQPRVLLRDLRRGTGLLRALGAAEGEVLVLEDGPGLSLQTVGRTDGRLGPRRGLPLGPSVRVAADAPSGRGAALSQGRGELERSLDVFELDQGTSVATIPRLPKVEDLAISRDRVAVVGAGGLHAFALRGDGGLQTGRPDGRFTLPLGLHLRGRTAFVADAFLGLRVVDLDDVLAPRLQGELPTFGASALALRGDQLLLGRSFGTVAVDVSEPSRPEPVGISALDLAEDNFGFEQSEAPLEIALDGDRAFVLHAFDGIEVLRIAPGHPPEEEGFVGGFGPRSRGDVHDGRLWLNEGDPRFGSSEQGMLVELDVSDPEAAFEAPVVLIDTPGEARDLVHLREGELLVADGTAGSLWLADAPAEPLPPPVRATPPKGSPPDGGGRLLFLPIAVAPAPAAKPERIVSLRSLGASGGAARAMARDGSRLWLAEGRRLSLLDAGEPGRGRQRGLTLPGSVARLDAAGGQVLAVTQASRGLQGGYPGPSVAPASGPGSLHLVASPAGGALRHVAQRRLEHRVIDVALRPRPGRDRAVVAFLGPRGTSGLQVLSLPELRPLATLTIDRAVPLRLEVVGERVLVLHGAGDDGLRWLTLDEPEGPRLGPEQDVDSLDFSVASMAIQGDLLFLLANPRLLSILRLGPGEEIQPVGNVSLQVLGDAARIHIWSAAMALSPGRLDLLQQMGTTMHHLDISRLDAVRYAGTSRLPRLQQRSFTLDGARPDMEAFEGRVIVAGGPHGGLLYGRPALASESAEREEPSPLTALPGAGVSTVLAREGSRLLSGNPDSQLLTELEVPPGPGLPRARASLPLPLQPTELRSAHGLWWLQGHGSILAAVRWPGGTSGRVEGISAAPNDGIFRGHDHQLAIAGELAFATEMDGIRAFDVADPGGPAPLSRLRLPGQARDLLHLPPWLVVANGPDGLVLLDPANPARLREVGHLPLPGEAHRLARVGEHVWVALRGNHRGFPGLTRHRARLVALALDPGEPSGLRPIAEVPLPADDVGDLAVLGDRLAVDLGDAGLALVDARIPTEAAIVARARLPGPAQDLFRGDLLAAGDRLHLALGQDGLWTVAVEGREQE